MKLCWQVLLSAAVLVVPSVASASDGDGPARLWVESAAPEKSCAAAASAINTELALGCDASRGACLVSRTREDATRILALRCGPATNPGVSSWALTAYDTDGQQRWRVDLGGADSDFARSAAMFAVRFESKDEPQAMPTARIEVAPQVSEPPRLRVDAPASAPAPSSSSTGKILAFTGLGGAVVGVVSGLALLLYARSRESDFEFTCAPNCFQSDVDKNNTRFRVADALLAVGATSAVVGTAGLVLWAHEPARAGEPHEKYGSTVRVTAGASWAGLTGSF